MGHSIDAVVVSGRIDQVRAREFDVKILPCLDGFTLIALDPNFVDEWAERLNIHGCVAPQPLMNFRVVHHIVGEIAGDSAFAIIGTEYFGGIGEQAAAVYKQNEELMPPMVAVNGPINDALELLGVPCIAGQDEFDSLGLGKYRDWDDLFQEYENEPGTK